MYYFRFGCRLFLDDFRLLLDFHRLAELLQTAIVGVGVVDAIASRAAALHRVSGRPYFLLFRFEAGRGRGIDDHTGSAIRFLMLLLVLVYLFLRGFQVLLGNDLLIITNLVLRSCCGAFCGHLLGSGQIVIRGRRRRGLVGLGRIHRVHANVQPLFQKAPGFTVLLFRMIVLREFRLDHDHALAGLALLVAIDLGGQNWRSYWRPRGLDNFSLGFFLLLPFPFQPCARPLDIDILTGSS